jgi:hypothetical protein
MHIYVITMNSEDLNPRYRGTVADAHDVMKTILKDLRTEARCELLDMLTDKASLIELLATGQPVLGPVLRTWVVTDRGGMKEVPNGE